MARRITIDLTDTAESAIDRLSAKLHLNTADTFRRAMSVLYRQEFGEDGTLCEAGAKPDEPRGNGVAARRDGQFENIGEAVERLRQLTDEQRVDVMRHFCSSCGGPPDCQCWNDE